MNVERYGNARDARYPGQRRGCKRYMRCARAQLVLGNGRPPRSAMGRQPPYNKRPRSARSGRPKSCSSHPTVYRRIDGVEYIVEAFGPPIPNLKSSDLCDLSLGFSGLRDTEHESANPDYFTCTAAAVESRTQQPCSTDFVVSNHQSMSRPTASPFVAG